MKNNKKMNKYINLNHKNLPKNQNLNQDQEVKENPWVNHLQMKYHKNKDILRIYNIHYLIKPLVIQLKF